MLISGNERVREDVGLFIQTLRENITQKCT